MIKLRQIYKCVICENIIEVLHEELGVFDCLG